MSETGHQHSTGDPSTIADNLPTDQQETVGRHASNSCWSGSSLQSVETMEEMQRDWTELVTNIQVAADARESQCRADMFEAGRLRVEKLENEAKSSLEKCEEIIRKWTVTKVKEFPQDLRDSLNSQQQLCARIIEDKNKVIQELQQEIKLSDDCFVKDRKTQAEHMDLIIDRMEEQVNFLMGSYRDELVQFENSLEQERRILLTGNRRKWEQHMEERRHKELENAMQRMRRVEEYDKSLQQLRTSEAEDLIKLDTDKMQQIKATLQLRQETHHYCLEVMKNIDGDNTIVKSLMTEKINRWQDVVSRLKIKCANEEKLAWEVYQKLTEDYKLKMQQYKDLQKKKQLAAIHAKRFEEIWLMNKEEVKALVTKALDTDRLIHEQLLGLSWQPPPLGFMEQCGSLKNQRQAQSTACQTAAELLRPEGTSPCHLGKYKEASAGPRDVCESGAGQETGSSKTNRVGSGGKNSGTVLVKKIQELLCDKAGFLIESQLFKILSPLEKDEQCLMKMDSIFTAMGIESKEDVHKLAMFFTNYRQPQGDPYLTQDVSARCGAVASYQEEAGERSYCSPTSDLMNPNDVLVALKAFTAYHCRHSDGHDCVSREVVAPKDPSMLAVGGRDNSEDAAYWKAMADVIPEAKLKVWDALETALNKYHVVLTDKSKLIKDTQRLRQQNAELQKLLQQQANSRVRPGQDKVHGMDPAR
ncbi:dynein regulatory complex protein 1-like isoform X2 [Esox lucius]|uniref:dynein regulatory complex protein 1-like isoform X2 n=1 Tax=Esox lucius TaxID=8010 RepID=UPI0014776FF1|nr:dynein regulatory complex protein 1-like isoform X2 [Esox lucius]